MKIQKPKAFVTLGFVVKAGIEGKKADQPISKRFSSMSAAESFCELAIKAGFKDAYVESVEGYEPDLESTKKRHKEAVPKTA